MWCAVGFKITYLLESYNLILRPYSLDLKHFWRRQWQRTPVLLPGKSHGRRILVGCSPWGCEESDMTERLIPAVQGTLKSLLLEPKPKPMTAFLVTIFPCSSILPKWRQAVWWAYVDMKWWSQRIFQIFIFLFYIFLSYHWIYHDCVRIKDSDIYGFLRKAPQI